MSIRHWAARWHSVGERPPPPNVTSGLRAPHVTSGLRSAQRETKTPKGFGSICSPMCRYALESHRQLSGMDREGALLLAWRVLLCRGRVRAGRLLTAVGAVPSLLLSIRIVGKQPNTG